MGDPPVDGASVEDAPPFFRGYGATETDWAALTYYRCERVVTDVLVSAEEVLFRDDLSAEIRSDAVLLLDEIFAVGSSFEWARTTAANLPPGLHALG